MRDKIVLFQFNLHSVQTIWSGCCSKELWAASSSRFHPTLTSIIEFCSHKMIQVLLHFCFWTLWIGRVSCLRPLHTKGFLEELFVIGILCCFTQIQEERRQKCLIEDCSLFYVALCIKGGLSHSLSENAEENFQDILWNCCCIALHCSPTGKPQDRITYWLKCVWVTEDNTEWLVFLLPYNFHVTVA